MKTVAVIQPYFFPYAGYFRLYAAADTVVMFDCVQFPRRGWVHRNRFSTSGGASDWLTLPIAYAQRDARIADLRFAPDARARMEAAIRRFPTLAEGRRAAAPLVERMFDVGESVTDYLCARLDDVADALGLARAAVRSSCLDIPPSLHGQDRVIAIVKALGGTHYVNPSGGRELYDHAGFERAGLKLGFLSPYGSSTASILERLLVERSGPLVDEIRRETVVSR